MLKFFYSRVEHTSKGQLQEDFGEFPPFPLQCVPPTSTFVVVRVRGLGTWVNYWRRSAELLHALDKAPDTVPPVFVEALSGLRRSETPTGQKNDQSSISERYAFPRQFIRIICMFAFWRVEASHKLAMGHVIPITQHDRQITLLARANTRKGQASEVLAHEHLHFLQNHNAVSRSKEVRDPHQLLAEKWVHDRFALYLLERVEVEARLHELVLSYYRARHVLPETVNGFLGMLADWEEIGEYLVQTFSYLGLEMQGTGHYFKPRSVLLGSQLGDLLSLMNAPETTARFVSEVLAVMYGNLLYYYGDTHASERFLAQIPRPNLYDSLYD